jgi:5-methylcytosine-specific restriction endonuclease McrA
VLRRANLACEECGYNRPLEMHHLRYRRDYGALIFGSETPDDLDALCRDCHLGRHLDPNGDYWADPEDKESHWAGWDEAAD